MGVMTDSEVIKAYAEFMEANPYATRHKIERSLNVTCKRLEKLGCKLPLKIHPAAAAGMARKSGGWGKNFSLRGRNAAS